MSEAQVNVNKQEQCLNTLFEQLNELEQITSKMPITSGLIKKFLKTMSNLEERIKNITINLCQKANSSMTTISNEDKEIQRAILGVSSVTQIHKAFSNEPRNMTEFGRSTSDQKDMPSISNPERNKDMTLTLDDRNAQVQQQIKGSSNQNNNMGTTNMEPIVKQKEGSDEPMDTKKHYAIKSKPSKKPIVIENVTHCTQCNAKFIGNKAKYNYQRHKVKCKQTPCNCPQTGQHIFPCINRNTRGYGDHQCDACSKRFHKKSHLNMHIKNKHKQQTY